MPPDRTVAYYVEHNYSRLLTNRESAAARAVRARARLSYFPEPRRRAAIERLYLKNDTLGAEAEAPLADGVDAFWDRVVERVLREHADEVLLNRCARCDALCRTPLAQQCLTCGHDWHSAARRA